jgi:glutamine synthetase
VLRRPEAEFYIFDNVSFDQHAHAAFFKIDSSEARWNGGQAQQAYFLTPPADAHADLRARIVAALEEMGIPCEVQHHEVGSAGQAETNVRFATLLRMADRLQMQKYVVRNVAGADGALAQSATHAAGRLPWRSDRDLQRARPPARTLPKERQTYAVA